MLMKYIPSGRPFRFISVSSPSITSDNTSTPSLVYIVTFSSTKLVVLIRIVLVIGLG